MTTLMKIENIQPGMTVHYEGYLWRVKKNHFDPYGNTGHQPRHLLAAEQIVRDGETPLPDGYRYNMTIGRIVGWEFPVEKL